jgi:hypothetical protein
MYQAAHMDHVHVPMLLLGVTFDTSPTDYSPVKQMQLRALPRHAPGRLRRYRQRLAGPALLPAVPPLRRMSGWRWSSRRQAVVFEHLPEARLQHFAGAAVWHLRQEDDIVGQLPSRDLALEKLSDRLER